jgi:hypothetical protein
MTEMLRLTDLRWRKRRTPSDILIGKVGDFWVMVVPRSPRQLGPDDIAEPDPVYATLFIAAAKPFDGPDPPEKEPGRA